MDNKNSDLLQTKEQELIDLFISNGYSEDLYNELKANDSISQSIVEEKYIEEDPEDQNKMCLVTCNPHTNEYKSRKLYNIRFNLFDLLKSTVGIAALAKAIGSNDGFSIVNGVLNLISNVDKTLSIKLTGIEGTILGVLWGKFGYRAAGIDLVKGYDAVNEYLASHEKDTVGMRAYNEALNNLERIHSIELIDEKIILQEKVSASVVIK